MAIDKHGSRIWRNQIRDILNRDWDPIGSGTATCPEDEYDAYVGQIAAMIRDGATDDELLSYLEWAEEEHIGLPPFNRDRGLRVIAAIRALGPAPTLD